MAQNPLSKMIEGTKSGLAETSGLGAELKAKGEMMNQAKEALGKSEPMAPKPAAPARSQATWEKTAGKPAPKGEKEMYKNASEWAKPMSFKDGGMVEKSGTAEVHKGEVVLPHQDNKDAWQTLPDRLRGAGQAARAVAENVTNPSQAVSNFRTPPKQKTPSAPDKNYSAYGAYTMRAKPDNYAEGGEVEKTGVAVVHKGEHVLTPEHKNHIKAALSMAEGALSHMPEHKDEPKKEVAEMRIRKGASGGHIVKHIHVHMHLHPDEEHVTHDTDGLVNHVMQHMTEPNEGEMEAEAGDPGINEMEHAVGYKG